MRRFWLGMMCTMALCANASAATIYSFSDTVQTQEVSAGDQTALLAAILSQISFVASAPQERSQTIGFPVSIFVAVDTEPPVLVPEPSSFLLSCLGLVGLAAFGRRRSR